MPTITFKVKFFGGLGTAVFDGENIPGHTTIQSDRPELEFSVDQPTGGKAVAVTGTVPAGDALLKGKVTVEVFQVADLRSSAEDNTYVSKITGGLNDFSFNSVIFYEVL